MANDNLPRNDDGTLQEYAWPGGYPIFYVVKDGGTLCPKCANDNKARTLEGDDDCPDDNQWLIIAAEINWEDSSLQCDNCNKRIESAYAEDEMENKN